MQGVQSIRSGDQDRIERKFEQIIGASSALETVIQQVECVAPTDSTVLIEGETGTGKELIARAVHNLSQRCGRPFIKLNCAAIPFDLMESELFGHEKGAFTGAVAQRTGRFELADKGTLLLDEVSDIPLGLQPKLLRVLQEHELERLGGSHTHRVDVRLVAATNQNLASMVELSQFRDDLYYRLNVFPIHVPPLRERREDIPLLVEHFVRYFSERMNKRIDTIPSETMQALTRHGWPGNIRELQNVIERAVILSNSNIFAVDEAWLKREPSEVPHPSAALTRTMPCEDREKIQTLAEAEREHILAALKEANWSSPDRTARPRAWQSNAPLFNSA